MLTEVRVEILEGERRRVQRVRIRRRAQGLTQSAAESATMSRCPDTAGH